MNVGCSGEAARIIKQNFDKYVLMTRDLRLEIAKP